MSAGVGTCFDDRLGLENANLIEKIEYLLHVKFRRIPLSDCGELQISDTRRLEWPQLLKDRSEIHQFGIKN